MALLDRRCSSSYISPRKEAFLWAQLPGAFLHFLPVSSSEAPHPHPPTGGAFDFQGRVLELQPGAPCEVTLVPAPKDILTSFWTQWQRQVSTQVAGHSGQPPGLQRKVPRVQYEPKRKPHLFCVQWEQESLRSRVLSLLERKQGPPRR